MTYLIFDLVIAAVLLFFAWRGYRKGLVLTLCGFLAIFVAFIGANMVSNTLSAPVSRIIQPIVEHNIQQLFLEHLPQSSEQDSSSGADDLADPGSFVVDGPRQNSVELSLQQALELLKDSPLYKSFADTLEKAVSNGMMAASANAARSISDYISRQIAQMALFIISFVLILVLWFFISHALDLACRLPVLSGLNHSSGALLGLFKGGVLVFILCWLLKGSFLPEKAIQSTYLLNFFCSASPLSFVF